MAICNQANGEAVLCGPLADQAALHGVLIEIRNLGLPLISVCQIELGAAAPEPHRAAGAAASEE